MKTKIELTENATMLVDANVQLPNAVKNVLGALIYTSGAFTEHRKENSDWFYKDANSLIEESQVSKKTFFRAINLLEANNFIERKSGSMKKGENKVTQYKILKGVNNLSNDTNECQKQFNDTLNDTLEKPLMTHKNKELSIKDKELSNKNKEEILNIINNIIEDNNNNLINNIKNIIKKEIENIKEKESYSSIESEKQSSINENKETKEIETMKELIDKINTLQDENSKLNERLDNSAKFCKKMMQTINELQQKVSELETKMYQTSNEDKTSTKQEKNDLKPSIDVDCILPHAKEEKPTVAQQMPSTAIVEDEVTPKEDVDVNEVMKDFANAVKQCEKEQKEHCNEVVLNEFKTLALQYIDEKNASYSKRKKVEERINNFINYYKRKSNSNPSNPSSGTTTHQEDLKPTESAEAALNQIVEEDTTEAISSPTANDNDSTLPTTHQEEERPTETQQMPLNEKKLRYLDTMTDKPYTTKEEAQKDGVKPRFLYDFKVGRCLWSYEDEDDTSTVQEKTPTIEENPSSGITTQPNEEKPTESVSEPSMEIVEDDAIQKKDEYYEDEASNDGSSIVNQEKEENALNERESFLYTVAEVFADLRKRSYINYKDKTDQLKEVWNVILSKEDFLSQEDLEACQKELKEMLCQANVSSY